MDLMSILKDEVIVEYSPSYEEERKVFRGHPLYYSRFQEWTTKAVHHAKDLRKNGHKSTRVVMDGWWEYALTCDDCMLWANVTRKLKGAKNSYDSASGDLLEVLTCDPEELHRRFGVPSDGSSAWEGYTAWTIEPWFNAELAATTKFRRAFSGTAKTPWNQIHASDEEDPEIVERHQYTRREHNIE